MSRTAILLSAAALAAFSAAPASAQVFGQGGGQRCGTAAADVTWIGGTAAASDIATSPTPFYTTAEVGGQAPRYFGFMVTADAYLRLEAISFSGGDTVIALVDAAGTAIASDDDSGGNFSSRLETYVAAGEYCLLVGGYTETVIPVDIQIGRADEHAAITPGQSDVMPSPAACTADTPATDLPGGPLDATLAAGSSVSLDVVPATQPYHRFVLSQPSSMTLTADNESADPVIRLYDGTGLLIFENDDSRTLNSLLHIVDALPAGTYCVEVNALSDPSLPIVFTAAPFDEAAYLRAAYDAAEISPPLDGSHPVTDVGTLSTSITEDVVLGGAAAKWISFTVTEPSLVVVGTVGFQGSDTILALFGPDGQLIDRNDDAMMGQPNARVVGELAPGTYTIAAMVYQGSPAGGARVLIERYVRAQ